MKNLRFVPQMLGGGYFALYEQNNPPKWQLRTRCGGHRCRRSVQALAHMLCHVPMIGSCSQFCFTLQPHRVAAPFPPSVASPWRNSFVQIHGGTTLLRAKFGTTPQKRLNWGVGSSYGANKPPLPNPSFPYENVNFTWITGPITRNGTNRTIYTELMYALC